MEEILIPELILNISEYLNPADKWRLSTTSKSMNKLLPTPLRIKIVSPSSNSTLSPKFYVSPVLTPQDCLTSNESLKYDEEYLFWTYDYERENRVFLGRHGQKKLYNDLPHYLYTLGLRPVEPNQTWKVRRSSSTTTATRTTSTTTTTTTTTSNSDSAVVPFDAPIGLDVGGTCTKPHRPDSNQRLFLSAHTLTKGALWYVIQDKISTDEGLHLVRCQDYVPMPDVVEKEVIVHAIPDVMDGGYSLYSPQRLKAGKAACELFHANVSFHYWIKDGMMYFHAHDALDFAFGVPILEEDCVLERNLPTSPLKVLLQKNSSRWWATKHYMSNAADVSEGVTFNMEAFMRSSKDHEDHTIVLDKKSIDIPVVYIEVQDAIVDKTFPKLERNTKECWQFLLCA